MSDSVGNLDPRRFRLGDFTSAISLTHDLQEPAPPFASIELMREVADVPPSKSAVESYKSALMWGITIGVLAERERRHRIGHGF